VLRGEVVVAELLGGESYLHVRAGDATIVIKTDGNIAPQRGDIIEAAMPAAFAHLFDADSRRIGGAAAPAIAASH
jgi:multiple sugar transport system ATP-binding protein